MIISFNLLFIFHLLNFKNIIYFFQLLLILKQKCHIFSKNTFNFVLDRKKLKILNCIFINIYENKKEVLFYFFLIFYLFL